MNVTRTNFGGHDVFMKKGNVSGARKPSPHFPQALKAAMEETQQTVTKPAGKEPIAYIVKKGDTLWHIGRRLFNVDPYQIARDNGLEDPNRLRPGQKLLINPPDSPPVQARVKIDGVVTASWYGQEHHKKLTASGQPFDMYKNTLAHKTLPLGTKVRLINPENGRSVEGVINDRGPYVRGREVDVSYAIARQLDFVRKGVTKLNIEEI